MSLSPAVEQLLEHPDKVRKILAVRLDNIGDVIMLGPALRALRAYFPQAQITLMASPAGSQVAGLLPWIDEVLTWRALWQDVSGSVEEDPQREKELVDYLQQQNFEAAFIFTSFSQSPHAPGMICYLAGIPVRVGHSKEFGGSVLNLNAKPPEDCGHQVERNLALLELAGIPIHDRSLELFVPPLVQNEADQILKEAGIDPFEPFIAAAPGASCEARRYPPERFAEAARQLAARSGLPMVILGSEREKETLAPFARSGEQTPWKSLLGQTSVAQLAAVIRRSALVLANNSASLHIADAFQRPMVILYSGTEYITQWEPRVSPARLLRCEVPCSPCYQFRCPYQLECLDIPPKEVANTALELLAIQSPKPYSGDLFFS
jgi:lipopolysaccharide heptosyltransferase II